VELILGGLLAAVLLTLGAGFGLAQIRLDPEAMPRLGRVARVRRLAGSVLMIVIAVLMLVGLTTDARLGVFERRVWSGSWLGVMLGVGVLLVLGLWDFFAVRAYGRRQRLALAAERRALLAIETERQRRARNRTTRPDEGDETPSAM
jgi:hypothetical protein